MLIAPSWGGMINGLFTLRGAWDRVRKDPVLKFMVVGVTAYGMATFEGPMMSFKNVNAIVHYTDYIISHVHTAGLLWNGGLTFAMLYFIIPRIFNTPLYSVKLANFHFWMATLGTVIYVIPIYWGGVVQSLMWKEFNDAGTLMYPNFMETVLHLIPMYFARAIGGTMFFIGILAGMFNLQKTMRSGSLISDEKAEANAAEFRADRRKGGSFHRWLEASPTQFTALTIVAILIGGIVEYIPTALVKSNVPTIESVKPYTPLELVGRDIYIAEGCVGCHSQMIRPFRSETERYGEYSKAGEFVYDRPFLWGSKRTGPDLHRIGGKRTDSWHYMHFMDSRSISPGSIMPSYPWFLDRKVNLDEVPAKIRVLQRLGVPYRDGYDQEAVADLRAQAEVIASGLQASGFDADWDSHMIAVIAYMQRLGVDIKASPQSTSE